MDIITFIGFLGAGIILLLFILNEMGKVTTEDFVYDLGNAIGGSLLVVFAYLTDSMPFLILNGVWALVSWRDVLRNPSFPRGKKALRK